MTNQPERTPRSEAFRAAIAAFIDERREAKQKGKEVDADSASKFDYHAWLADAARRVAQIQAVTHVLKATHPDARGSSLYVAPGELPQHDEVGTHSLGQHFVEDVDGNSGSLGAFQLLNKVRVDGRRLLDWVQVDDDDLAAALHDDPEISKAWMTAFKELVRQGGPLVSHGLAKQLYWLVGEDPKEDCDFHLLQPMFASSLLSAVHEEIREAQFGEANSSLRKSRRANQTAGGVNREYMNLAIRRLGGSNPQNVSQLNAKRGGVNYLLASLPPQWQSAKGPRLQGRSTAMAVFGQMTEVKRLVHALAQFLKFDPPPNLPTRLRREGLEQALGAQLLAFVEWVEASLPMGWTRASDCTLPECEKLWLDAGRADPERHGADDAEADEAFARAYHWGDWPDQVASRFAAWLNDSLREKGVMGLDVDAHRHWAKQAVIAAAWPVPQQRRAEEVAA